MKVLITGAFGFVGRNLSAHLAGKEHEVWALDVCVGAGHSRQSASGTSSSLILPPSSLPYTRCYTWKQLEEIPWGEVDAVIHLAGKAHDTKKADDPQSYFEVNVGLTKKIISSLVHYCESALVGRSEDGGRRTEDSKRSSKVRECESALVGRSEDGETVGNRQPAIGSKDVSREDAKTQRGEDRGRRTEDGRGSTNELMNSRTNELPPVNSRTKALPKFILFSSVKAVADRVDGLLTEEAVPEPKTPYGQSKLEAEGEVLKFGSSKVRKLEDAIDNRQSATGNGERSSLLHYCDSALVGKDARISSPPDGLGLTNELTHSRTNELLYYILRPCMIHGPGNKGNLNLLYGMVRRGMPWPLGTFENQRSFAAIGNVCAVVEGLLAGDVASGVYQVADDEALSTNELIGLMAEVMERRTRVWRIPAGLMRSAARMGDILHLPLNSERLKKLTESYVVSNAKIKKALGWEMMPVSAEEGMRKTLESFGQSAMGNGQ